MGVIGIFVTIAFGLFFYLLRCRWQLFYGLVELVVALAVIFLTFYPQTNYFEFSQGPTLVGRLLSRSVGASAGIYVMVRGLDNIGKGLPLTWRCKWERIFCGQA
jgi:hypothetical protein